MTINKIHYNWFQCGNSSDGFGEDYSSVEVGKEFREKGCIPFVVEKIEEVCEDDNPRNTVFHVIGNRGKCMVTIYNANLVLRAE